MLFENHRLAIPSNVEYSVPQLRFMLQEVEGVIGRETSNDEWVRLQLKQVKPFVSFDLISCPICSEAIEESGLATQVFRRNGVVVTITGIPAVALCPNCGNAVLEWEVAQQVEDLIQPMFQWAETHSLPKPIVTITFPEMAAVVA